ncbi:MAG: aspartate-semialdehyde dehydrogenase [Clostridiales bacterium]|nr:aspartate-semialdehyde dehydrogenase [Clostridiales bacterium]
MKEKMYRVGIVGATGMVGQRFVRLMENHPWFRVTCLMASERSAGKSYRDAVGEKWAFDCPIPAYAADMIVMDAADIDAVAPLCDFVFCAVSMDKKATRELEESYARHEIPVVSNNSACRMLPDVPMLIPEVNADHTRVIAAQRKRLGTQHGFIAVKPNCSIQSYVPALTPLMPYGIEQISVCTYQAISGAGKTFKTWPEMEDNVIPFISGEEEKSEQEPLKVWGKVSQEGGRIVPAAAPVISAQCLRVPVQDGHMAAVSVKFTRKPEKEDILKLWQNGGTIAQELGLPSAPRPFLRYFEEDNRPQTRLDRDFEGGMGVTIGRLREDPLFDYKFVCLSHNTLRGAAGGAVLSAELLCAQGYITPKE